MAYVPPHMRKGNCARSPKAELMIPSFRRSLKFQSLGPKSGMHKSGENIYADTVISGWFAVGLDDKEADSPPPVLRRVSVEIERMTGEKPLALVNCALLNDGRASRDGAEKPWTYITRKILQDLIHSSEFVRNETGGEDRNSKEIRPKLVARVGKVLFLPRRFMTSEEEPKEDPVIEASLRQLKRRFHTNVPASCIEAVVDEVVPKIGVEFEDREDVYHLNLSDKSQPEATIWCKCRVVKEEDGLELYKIELNQIRHMVYDISCIKKNLDLRFMLCTKRTLTSLHDDEVKSIRTLINSAVLDSNSKGGLRWPFGKASSGDRYRVIQVWHTVSRVYESPLLRLKVRDEDWFDFRTSVGETTAAITLKLKGVISELLGKEKVVIDSVSDLLEDAVKMLWEHFLPTVTSVV